MIPIKATPSSDRPAMKEGLVSTDMTLNQQDNQHDSQDRRHNNGECYDMTLNQHDSHSMLQHDVQPARANTTTR